MVQIPTLEAPEAALAFLNPAATNYELSASRSQIVREHLLHPTHHSRDLTEIASPEAFTEIAGSTLVYAGGGDGTVRRVMSSIIGLVPNDPEATQRNHRLHTELARHLIFFAGKDGNACNFAVSAHHRYAAHPELLPYAREIQVGYHQPLIREVVDKDGNIVSSDVATSGAGLGGSAKASGDFQNAKPELDEMSPAERLIHETLIALKALRSAKPFTAEIGFTRDQTRKSFLLKDIDGVEVIGSETYAKQAHTSVNVDDTRWQPVVQHHSDDKVADTIDFAQSLARLRFSKHVIKPIDLQNMDVDIRILSDEPVQYHEDGETDEETVLEPGQTMRWYLSKIAVPTLMVR